MHIYVYFLPVLCKWQTIIFFPVVNFRFSTLPLRLSPFIQDNFLLISLRVMLSYSLHRKFWCLHVLVHTEFRVTVICSHIVSQFLGASSLLVLFVGKRFQVTFFQMSAYSHVPCCEFLGSKSRGDCALLQFCLRFFFFFDLESVLTG